MTEAGAPPPLVVETRVAASPETVFAYFVDPEKHRRWMGTEAELNPRPGGVYRLNVNGRNVVLGRYVELDPPRRIVLTWGWEDHDAVPPGSTTVEIDLVPDGDHTVVRLRHSGLPDDAEVAQHRQGWDHYAGRLALAAAGADPGPDPMAGDRASRAT